MFGYELTVSVVSTVNCTTAISTSWSFQSSKGNPRVHVIGMQSQHDDCPYFFWKTGSWHTKALHAIYRTWTSYSPNLLLYTSRVGLIVFVSLSTLSTFHASTITPLLSIFVLFLIWTTIPTVILFLRNVTFRLTEATFSLANFFFIRINCHLKKKNLTQSKVLKACR